MRQKKRLGEVLTELDREQPASFVRLSRWCEGFRNADEFVLGRDAVWEPCFDGSVFVERDFVSPIVPTFHRAFVGHLSRLGADDAAKSFPLTDPRHVERQIPEKLCYVIGRARQLCKELEKRAGGLSCDIEPVNIPCDESWESVRTLDEFQTELNRRIVEVEQLLPAQRGHSQAISLWTAYWQAREWLTRHGHENELPPLSEKLDDAYRWMQTRKGAAPDAMEALRVMRDLLAALSAPATTPHAAPSSGVKPVKRRSPKRRTALVESILTAKQLEAMQIVGECKGNLAEAARRLGRDRSTIKQHYDAATAKLGKRAVKHSTKQHATDRRGQASIATDADKRL